MRRARALLALAAALSCTAARASADEPISTDRPDFVESSDVVDARVVQIETGVALERDRTAAARTRTVSTPTLLRLGLGHRLELRLESDGFMRTRSTDEASGAVTRANGNADISVGVKWHVQDGDEAAGTPSTAWLLHADLATGSGPFRGDGVRPSLRFVAEWDLGAWSVGVMPGIARDTAPDGRTFAAGILAVTAGTELAPLWRGFVELAGERLASRAHGGSLASFDAGIVRRIGADMQIDASLQRGLTRDTPDWNVALGWSVRF